MIYLWLGLGAAAVVVAFLLYIVFTAYLTNQACRRRSAVRQQQRSAEQAMVQTVQNTIAEMFDAVRRGR